jgi:hypothetical protein
VASRLPLGALLAATAAAAVLVAPASAGPAGGFSILTPPPLPVGSWTAATDNLVAVQGTVTDGGAPVSGVRLRVDGYELPRPTDAQGRFAYLLDHTLMGRHVVSVVDASRAEVDGAPLSSAQQTTLAASVGAISVAYPLRDLHASRNAAGQPVVHGRFTFAGLDAPLVSLYSYRLTGTVLDGSGKPFVGARVSTRTLDRDYWTVSSPTDSHGRFSSLFTASSETGKNPVPMTVRVSKGDFVDQFLLEEYVDFQLLKSARLIIRLPPAGYPMVLPLPQSYPGAVYQGLVVGAALGGTPVRPVAATWPDAQGRFTITLPRRLAGKRVSLWEATLDLFSPGAARPGGPIDLADWPASLPGDAPRDLATLRLRP